MKDSMRHVFIMIIGLFVLLGGYLTYIQVVQGSELSAHALNRRNWEMSKTVPRGSIVDKNGEIIVRSVPADAGKNVRYAREYTEGAIFAPLTGFISNKYGKTGLENSFNQYLSGVANPRSQLGPISNLWQRNGYNVILSIDAAIQRKAYRALGDHKGAVVVMEPGTGRILALVSKPSYDPMQIDSSWQKILENPDSLLLNRALQGLYPPGSAIKPLVAAAALEEGVTSGKKTYTSPGYLKIGNYTLHEVDARPLGEIGLEKAMALSSNVAFGQMGLDLGGDRLSKYFNKFGFSQKPPLNLPVEQNSLPAFNKLTGGELAQTAIGQGELLVTPMSMALMTSAIANRGVIMKPLLVTGITDDQGKVVKKFSSEVWLKAVAPEMANTVQQLMESVVDWGTGTRAGIRGVRIAGKTGTAENPHGEPHAWFIGLAPVEKPEIVVVVIVENGGSGGAVAAPIARRIFAEAL